MLAVLAVAIVLASCGASKRRDSGSSLRGASLEVLGSWAGTEQEHFESVLRAFTAETGVTVTYVSAGHTVPATLAARLADGTAPDVAFLPQPGLLRSLVTDNRLVRLDGAVADTVARNYSAVWRDLGSVDGHLYGVWFKAANKSLIWYNVGLFERFGMVPPADVDALLEAADRLSSAGVPAFAVGGKDGWTLTDWFENLYLRVAGPDRYDRLATHRLPWTDDSVKTTLRLLAALLAPNHVAGGSAGALGTSYEASVRHVYTEPPSAAMVFEGDFVAGVIDATTPSALGVTADVFPFPPIGASGPVVVGGGDAAVLTKDSPAGVALLRYLAGPQAAAIWARLGGFISPNWNVDLSVYPDPITRMIVRSLVDAGDDFRFDLSDLQPAAFGATPSGGMRKLLQDFIADPDVDRTASQLEAAAAEAFAS